MTNSNDKIEECFEGFWWEIDNPEITFQGRLERFESGKMILSIVSYHSSSLSLNPAPFKPKTLQGLVKSSISGADRTIILFYLFFYSEKTSTITSRKYFVNYLLISEPNNDVKLLFDVIYLSSQKLSDWISVTGFEFETHNYEKFQSTIKYEVPDETLLFSNESISIKIGFSASRKQENRRQALLSEKPQLTLSFADPISLDGMFSQVKSIERFFMMLWERPHNFQGIILGAVNEVRYTFRDTRTIKNGINKRTLSYGDFISNSNSIFSNWLEISKQFDLPLRAFFFAFSDTSLGIHNRFLNYVFALEQLHRTGFRANEPLSSKNERMFQKALDEVNHDTKSWLEKILSTSKDIAIKDRLVELRDFSEYDDLANEEIEKVKNTRHYLVHLDGGRKPNTFDSQGFVDINEKLYSLFLSVLNRIVVDGMKYPLKN